MKDFPDFGNSYDPPAGAIIPDFDDLDPALFRSEGNYEPDLAAACGIDLPQSKVAAAVKVGIHDQRQSARPAPADPVKPRFVMIDQFCALPPQQNWIVRRYLEPDTLCVLYGDSQAFKSFLAIDLICHIATGKAWRGNKTAQGFCIYIAGEGGNGLSKRFVAWFQHHGEPMRNIAVSTVPLALCEPGNVELLIHDVLALVASLGVPVSVIVLDTLSTHFGPGDENKTSEMRAFMQGIRQLRIETGAAIVVPHHVGHQNKERERGSISLAQDVDWRYRVERSPETMITTLINMKARDSEPPAALSWQLQVAPLPWVEEDDDGLWIPMTSLVPVPVEAPEVEAKQEFMPKAMRIALSALRTALMDHGVEENGVVSVADDQWREAAYDAGVSSSDKQDTRKKAFNRCKADLIEAGKVAVHEGRFWVPKPTGTKRDITGQCPGSPPGYEGEERDITGHIPLGMSRCVPPPTNPTLGSVRAQNDPVGSVGDRP
jgi:hypothetical protein